MKKLYVSVLLAISCMVAHESVAQWQLVWQDEFNGSISPDWVFETGGGGWGNNELEYYRRENATVENGNLVITARREDFGGRNYTSSRMKSQGRKSFKYGKIEARMALPTGAGLWPAFWMLGDNISSVGWPACGEIDIMEHVNSDNIVHGTVHWQDNNGNYASYSGSKSTNVNAYHTYAIEWNDRYIRWFVDGQQYHEVNIANGINGTSEFQSNFFILLNFAVGGNWPGFNVDNGRLPARMLVDYVRVYQGGGPPTNNFSLFREAEAFSTMNGVQTENCAEGGQNVGYIDQGDWMAYNNVAIPISGNYTIQYRVASPGGSRLSADLNGGSVQLGNVDIPATGGWQNWRTVTKNVYLNAGTYSFGIYAQQSGWNINWWKITAADNARTADGKKKAVDQVIEDEALSQKLPAGMLIYPNPVQNQISLAQGALQADSQISISDMSGKVIRKKQQVSAATIDVSALPKGIYILTVYSEGHQTQHKFIKE